MPFLHASITSLLLPVRSCRPCWRPSYLIRQEGHGKQAEASRTAGRCDRKAFGATGMHGGKRYDR